MPFAQPSVDFTAEWRAAWRAYRLIAFAVPGCHTGRDSGELHCGQAACAAVLEVRA